MLVFSSDKSLAIETSHTMRKFFKYIFLHSRNLLGVRLFPACLCVPSSRSLTSASIFQPFAKSSSGAFVDNTAIFSTADLMKFPQPRHHSLSLSFFAVLWLCFFLTFKRMLRLLLLISAVNGAFQTPLFAVQWQMCPPFSPPEFSRFCFHTESINAFEKIINHFYSLRELEQNMQALLPV